MVLTYNQVKEDIYNYFINAATKSELLDRSKINTKMSQTYSDMPKGKGGTPDCVSNEVFRRMVLEVRIKKLDERIVYIDEAECVLDDLEKEVIAYLKQGYKMSRIAILMNISRRKVVYLRDKAIEKITNYTNKVLKYA